MKELRTRWGLADLRPMRKCIEAIISLQIGETHVCDAWHMTNQITRMFLAHTSSCRQCGIPFMKKSSRKKHKDKSRKNLSVIPEQSCRVSSFAPPLSEDSALNNTAWVKLVEECVDLYVELDRYLQKLDPSRREVAEHVCQRLTDILVRSGIDLIGESGPFDRNLHELAKPTTELSPVAGTVKIISPGFRIGRRVLLRAVVKTLSSN